MTDARQQNLIRVVVGFSLLTVFMCLQGGIAGVEAWTMKTRGVSTEAVVVGVDRAGKVKSTTVEFVHQGDTITADCNSCSLELDTSDRVRIRYDPARLTSDVEDADSSGSRNLAVVLSVIMLVCLAAAVFTGRRLLRERRRQEKVRQIFG